MPHFCRLPIVSWHPLEPFRKTIFEACLRVTLTYNAAETLVLIPLLRSPRRRMKKQPRNSAIGRREFLAATSGLLAASVPGGEMLAHAANSEAPVPSVSAAKPRLEAGPRNLPRGR